MFRACPSVASLGVAGEQQPQVVCNVWGGAGGQGKRRLVALLAGPAFGFSLRETPGLRRWRTPYVGLHWLENWGSVHSEPVDDSRSREAAEPLGAARG